MTYKIRFLFAFVPAVFLSLFLLSCSSDKPVAEIGSEKIMLSAFENDFLISKGGNKEAAANSSIKEREAFLDNMIKTKIKYSEGINKKLDTTESFRTSLASAEKRLLAQEFIRRKIIDPNVEDYYNKTKYDLRVSHIFFQIDNNIQPEDSAKIYKLSMQIIEKLNSGVSFDTLARQYSNEEASKNKGGDLYYISPGMTVADFEIAAYSLNTGEYTRIPVRTPFGLHIIKVTDKKERMDSVRVSHILITDTVNDAGLKDSVKSYNSILAIKNKIKSKSDFEESALKFSNDTATGKKGGDLGFVKRRQYANNFDSTIFSLEPGKISDIIRSPFGWHLIMMTEAVKIKPYQDIKNIIENQFAGTQWFRNLYDKLCNELRTEYNVKIEENGVDFILDKIRDSTLAFMFLNPGMIFNEEDKKVVTGTFNEGVLTVNDLIAYISSNISAANTQLTRFNIKTLILGSSNIILESKKAKELGFDKDERYKKMLDEIRIFVISELVDKIVILPSISVSEKELTTYYEKNKDNLVVNKNGAIKQKTFDEAKSEITDIIRKSKLKASDESYTAELKSKYNVKTDYKVLEHAFKK